MSYYYMEEMLAALISGSIFLNIISLGISVVAIIAMWKIFVKAGEEGWAAIIPFYNLYVLYKIAWGNGWLFLLLLVPFAGFVVHIIMLVKLAKAFGKGGGFACGLIFLGPIFMCIMAFSDDIKYIGPDGGASPPPPGAYGAYQQNPYGNQYGAPNQNPYQPDYRQYQQGSAQNDQYRYQREAPPPPTAGGFCSGCGAALTPGTRFCASCGKPV